MRSLITIGGSFLWFALGMGLAVVSAWLQGRSEARPPRAIAFVERRPWVPWLLARADVARGPYTGCLGYLGFNRESQLSILIRTALCLDQMAYFHVGAGIVADSIPGAEYEETLAKAHGFLRALGLERMPEPEPEAKVLAVPSDWTVAGEARKS